VSTSWACLYLAVAFFHPTIDLVMSLLLTGGLRLAFLILAFVAGKALIANRKRQSFAIVPLLLGLIFFNAVKAWGIDARFRLVSDQYEAVVAQPWTADHSEGQWVTEDPFRVAFDIAPGMINHSEGLLYDPTGTASGRETFMSPYGQTGGCISLHGHWYWCWFD
jgi:hypothetical protein